MYSSFLGLITGAGGKSRTCYEFLLDWNCIFSVNSTSLISRTVDECKKKVSDLKVKAHKKERARVQYERGTGGGPPSEELSPLEKKVISKALIYSDLFLFFLLSVKYNYSLYDNQKITFKL